MISQLTVSEIFKLSSLGNIFLVVFVPLLHIILADLVVIGLAHSIGNVRVGAKRANLQLYKRDETTEQGEKCDSNDIQIPRLWPQALTFFFARAPYVLISGLGANKSISKTDEKKVFFPSVAPFLAISSVPDRLLTWAGAKAEATANVEARTTAVFMVANNEDL